MAGKRAAAASTAPKLNGIAVQSSIYGSALPIGWGSFRVPASLLWYNNFRSIAHTSTQSSGGKGGGGSSSSTSYTYSAAVILGLCAGPIDGVRTVYRDKSTFTTGATTALAQAGLSLASGDLGQATWGFLTASYPDEAIGYSGVAYAYAADYDLGSSATLGNHSFEVQTSHRVSGLDDANPADIVTDFLSRVPMWTSGLVDDLTNYRSYCLAANLLLSPVLDQQRRASDFLGEILKATNSEAVYSEGLLKIVPYGDTQVTANGQTWTPDLTPIYDLTNDDFLPASDGEDPVSIKIKRPADAYNYIQVEYRDRAHQYNTTLVPGVDQGNIDQFGKRQNQSPETLHCICNATTAAVVAQLLVQRSCYIRAEYSFRLSDNYGLLEPMDLVTITTGDLSRVLVRITDTQESENGDEIEITAEPVLVGMAHAASFSRQSMEGYTPEYDALPGPVTDFALINPPRTLTNGDYELWIAASGDSANWGGCDVWASFDNANYQRVGRVENPGRIGITLDALSVATDPDTTALIGIDLTGSNGDLLDGTQPDADYAVTLSLIGDELIAYRDSFMTSAHVYNIGYLRRGLYGTTIGSHGIGSPFIRLDDAIARVAYREEQANSTMYVKLCSFNIHGRQTEDISTVTAHTVTLTPGAAPVVDITANNLLGPGGVLLTWQDVYNALIKMSGKNLFRKSDWVASGAASAVTPTFGVAGWGFRMTGGAGDSVVKANRSGYGLVSTGDYYSYSFQAKLTTGTGSATIRAGWRTAGGATITDVPDQVYTITSAQQLCVKETIASADPNFASAYFQIFEVGGDVPSGKNVDITDLMMEAGTKASIGWRPSPDDVELLRYAGYLGDLNATKNQIFYQSSTPTASSTGDIWVDTSVAGQYATKRWSGSSWVIMATEGGSFGTNLYRTPGGSLATLADFLTSLGVASAISGQGSMATANHYVQSSDPGSVPDGTLWTDTSGAYRILKQRVGGAWQVVANNSTGGSSPLTVSVSPTSASWSGFGAGYKTTSGSAPSVSVSGGSGSYSYSWSLRNGDAMVVNSPNSSATTFSKQVQVGSTFDATYRCWVQDLSTGVIGYADVTVTFSELT